MASVDNGVVKTAIELAVETESVEGGREASERSKGCRLLLLDVVSIGSAKKRLVGGAGDAIGCTEGVGFEEKRIG